MPVPSPSPFGYGQKLGEDGVVPDSGARTPKEILTALDDEFTSGNIVDHKRNRWEWLYQVRLPTGQKFGYWLGLNRDSKLHRSDVAFLKKTLRPYVSAYNGAQAVLETLLEQESKILRIFIKLWRSIDTCLALSFEAETASVTRFKTAWWTNIARLVIRHKSVHYAGKSWARFARYCELYYGGAIEPTPIWEASWPRLPEDTWMTKSPGELSRRDIASWSILVSTRGLPSGDHVTEQIALEAHAEALLEDRRLSDAKLVLLDQAARIAGERVKRNVRHTFFERKSGHISISNSACYEFSRSEGGRRQFVLEHLRDWLDGVPVKDRLTPLPTGETIIEGAGRKRFETVKPPLLDSVEPGNLFKRSSGLLTEDFPGQEQERVGFQLFAWSFLELLDNGFIDKDGYPTGKPLPIKRETVPEPGIKCRIVTKSLAAFVTYGQAWGHVMKDMLMEDPTLRAGLGSGAQAFEWLKSLGRHQTEVPRYIMVGDFESATDHVNHEAGRVAMHAFCDGLGLSSKYIHGYIDLLLSPRIFEEDDMVYISNTGSLMGEPGTKVVLTALGKIANVYAHSSEESVYFATAGDDQIDAGDRSEPLLRYAEAARITTMIPSKEKWGVFKYAVRYCQAVLLPNSQVSHAEVAVPKVRLLSPETKQRRGDDDTNPAYGKAKALATECSWSEFPDLCKCMVYLFLRNMSQYIEYSHELFTPREWGGLGLPYVPISALWARIPEWKRCAISQRENGCPLTRRLLSRWSNSVNFQRGIDLSEDNAYNTYYELILNWVPTVNRPEQIPLEMPEGSRYRDIVREMAHHGWTPISDLVTRILASQRYQSFWDPGQAKPDRGYKSLPWSERTKRIREAFLAVQTLTDPPPEPPCEAPMWHPEDFALCEGTLYLHRNESNRVDVEVEDGEIPEELLPLVGPGLAGPRVFLHFSNERLARS
jgi:hypothetical protein